MMNQTAAATESADGISAELPDPRATVRSAEPGSVQPAARVFISQTAPPHHVAYKERAGAGALFLVAAAQFVFGLVIAEALYPGYSLSANYVSDLGVGPSSAIFNASVFILGALILAGVFLLRKSRRLRTVSILLLLMALGSMGVGVFTKDSTLVHGAVSSATFFFSALSAVASIRVLDMPFSLISGALGITSLGALALFSIGMVESGSITGTEAIDSAYYLGLGPGGMERMIVYPGLVWLAAFGGHLLRNENAEANSVT